MRVPEKTHEQYEYQNAPSDTGDMYDRAFCSCPTIGPSTCPTNAVITRATLLPAVHRPSKAIYPSTSNGKSHTR